MLIMYWRHTDITGWSYIGDTLTSEMSRAHVLCHHTFILVRKAMGLAYTGMCCCVAQLQTCCDMHDTCGMQVWGDGETAHGQLAAAASTITAWFQHPNQS